MGKVKATVLAIAVMALFAASVFALPIINSRAEGSGDQSGKSDGNALRSSTIVDGDTSISIKPVIELIFTGRVDDIQVLSYNKDCFHLQNTAGDVETLQIIFPDTQVQKQYRNHVFLIPEKELVPGQSYTLSVDKSLSDKNGNTLSEAVRIHFSTATDENFSRLKENEDLLALRDNILSYNTALPPKSDSSDPEQSVVPETEALDAEPGGLSTQTIICIAVPVLLLALAAVFLNNRKAAKQEKTENQN